MSIEALKACALLSSFALLCFAYSIRKIIWPSFVRKKVVGEGDPFYLKFVVTARLSEIADF